MNIFRKKNGTFFFNLIKKRCVLLRSFFCEICSFCMTYETKKNVPFFYEEWKRKQRSFRSFIKNGKKRKDCSVPL